MASMQKNTCSSLIWKSENAKSKIATIVSDKLINSRKMD